ncbi:MAG: 3-hydroxybutyrate dehydrogenase [Chloroflexi bacterium]|nr:3-hydroxybutyrate dehydrogenase [Chloroflexota bacterium]
MSDKPLHGKVAIITGAASGIGLAIAERFAADGARVVIGDANAAAGAAIAQRLGGLFVPGDLSRRESCLALVDRTVEAFGTVHILVNNAGFQSINPIPDFPEDTWERMIAVMLTAPFLLTRYAWPHMQRQRWGRIINMGSVHSLRASPFKAGYVSAKHGLVGLTRTIAREGGPHGILAHVVCPGYVRTPLVENQIADQARTRGLRPDQVVEQVMTAPAAIKRLIEPAEVAEIVHFLCTDAAAAMTGTVIPIDLGWTAG